MSDEEHKQQEQFPKQPPKNPLEAFFGPAKDPEPGEEKEAKKGQDETAPNEEGEQPAPPATENQQETAPKQAEQTPAEPPQPQAEQSQREQETAPAAESPEEQPPQSGDRAAPETSEEGPAATTPSAEAPEQAGAPEPAPAQAAEAAPEQPADSTQSNEQATEQAPAAESDTDKPETDSEEEDEEEDDFVSPDYHSLSREELLRHAEAFWQAENLGRAHRELQKIRSILLDAEDQERERQLQKFLEEGGNRIDFHFKPDPQITEFKDKYRAFQKRRKEHRQKLEEQKKKNLKLKQDLIERLRNFVEGEQVAVNVDKLRAFQEEWRSIGQVPGPEAQNIVSTYRFLINKFYNNRSIHFELLDLDRKKNLEAKQRVIEKAKGLLEHDSASEAVKELRHLHEEFKDIGPVPKEKSEEIWQEFKQISDQIHERHRAHIEEIKAAHAENLKNKQALVEEVQPFEDFNSDNIKEWSAKTKEILQLRDRWNEIGPVDKEAAPNVSKAFWGAFKSFFNRKNEFFKQIDKEREDNLAAKKALVEKAEALKDSENWEETTQQMIDLQKEWKNIGPVPKKKSDEIYKRFKAAQDTFFDNKRKHFKLKDEEKSNNIAKKEALCEELESIQSGAEISEDYLRGAVERQGQIGELPEKVNRALQRRFEDALEKAIRNSAAIPEEQKDGLVTELKLASLSQLGEQGDQMLERQELKIRDKIKELEDEIGLWKDNMAYFQNSRNAQALQTEVQSKIATNEEKVEQLKAKRKEIRKMRKKAQSQNDNPEKE